MQIKFNVLWKMVASRSRGKKCDAQINIQKYINLNLFFRGFIWPPQFFIYAFYFIMLPCCPSLILVLSTCYFASSCSSTFVEAVRQDDTLSAQQYLQLCICIYSCNCSCSCICNCICSLYLVSEVVS